MSHNSRPSRSSHAPCRYSPYSRSPSSSTLPSNLRRPLLGSDIPSPAPTNYHSLRPPTNSMAGHSPVPPPSLSARQYASSTPQPKPPWPRYSHHFSYLTSSNLFLGPAPLQSIHPLQSSQLLQADWPPAGVYPQQDESYPIYHSLLIEQQPLLLPRGQPSISTFQRPSISLPDSNIGTLDVLPLPISQRQSVQTWEQNYYSTPQALFPPPQHSQGQSYPVQGPIRPRYTTQGSFTHAHDFVVKDSVFIDNNAPTDNFMKDLLQHTIIGAEFDSSDRDPPPRCHPGTRLAILQRCLDFILDCHAEEEKLRWVVGPAGVGKSAVIQMVVEKVPDGVIFVSVFLSVNGRRDGNKIIMTIAYHLAVQIEAYGQFIRNEIIRDPSLVRKSLSVHFERFIVKPFIHQSLFSPSRRFLIAIDGLDECDDPRTQQKLLELITNFCISYPNAPIAWIIASRPEPHITSFFDMVEVQPIYIKEEIQIDSDDACTDVQRYLRDELSRIKLTKPSLKHRREWPSELEFTTIASAAGGLFAYASVVDRYIDNPYYRDTTTQLRHVLKVIGGIPLVDISERGHPMAQLDALYARILSNIPNDVMISVREMLLLWSYHPFRCDSRLLCNFLGLSEDTAYGAISYLHAVMRVPEADKADGEGLGYFHRSFLDFLGDSARSRFSHNIHDEAEQLAACTCLKGIEQVPLDSDGMASGHGDGINCYPLGVLRGGPGVCDNISLSWPGNERFQKTDADLRLELYRKSMYALCCKFDSSHPFYYGSMSCFQVLTSRFSAFYCDFPFIRLREFSFDEFRHQLTELGQLMQVPLRTLDYVAIFGDIELRFASPIGMDVELSDPWNPLCDHEKCELDSLQQRRGWVTKFQRPEPSDDNLDALDNGADTYISLRCMLPCRKVLPKSIDYRPCGKCSRIFARHFISNPDVLATVFVDSTGLSYVESSFVDPDDGVSEWRYRFCHSGPPKTISRCVVADIIDPEYC